MRRARSRPGLAALMVLAAAALWGAVFALRPVVGDSRAAVPVLLTVPVVLVGLAFGPWGGAAGGAVATALLAAWEAGGGNAGGLLGYLVSGATYLLVGIVAGWFADRLVSAGRGQSAATLRGARDRAELEEAQRLAHIGSWRWDRATGTMDWSPEMYRIFAIDPGTDPARLLATVAARLHPDDARDPLPIRDRALADLEPFVFDQRLVLPDGDVRHVMHRGEVIVDGAGQASGIRGTTQDVTRIRMAERAGQAAGERLLAVLDTMLDAFTVGVAVRDGAGRIVDFRIEYTNPPAGDLYGRSAQELVGRTWSELWPGTAASDVFHRYVEMVESGDPVVLFDEPFRLFEPDGPILGYVDSHAARLEDGYVAAWRDVSARRQDAEAMKAAAARFTAAFDNAPVGMALIDGTGIIVRANAELAAITGWNAAGLVGSAADALIEPSVREDVRAHLGRLLAGEAASYGSEMRFLTSDGGTRWVSVRAASVEDPGIRRFVVAHIEDIDERKRLEGRLQYMADHDPLTGSFNRRRFMEELNHQVAVDTRYQTGSAAIVVDLEHFKMINDTLGHPTGDRLIREIGRRLQARLRDSDIVGRLGGDEFAVLLPNADEQRAATVTESLLDSIRSSVLDHEGRTVSTTGSAGVARTNSADVSDANDVLANADLAMYAAKEAGRDTYVAYDPEGPHAARARARFRWLDRIRVALDEDLFVLHAQPILDLDAGTVTGCELLLRMREGDDLISPNLFLYVAERHGLAVAIDRHVINQAIDLAGRSGRPPEFRWEINLSADSLADPDIPDLIEEALGRSGVRPESVVFEITETAAIANMDTAERFARRITDIGCRFALDDFGAGYGSFYYLKHLPFEYLKIDGEFIRQLPDSDTDRVIVDAIVSAAHRLGKQTIAEYVGDAATLEVLRKLHVDHAQGYHIGRPVEPETMEAGAHPVDGDPLEGRAVLE